MAGWLTGRDCSFCATQMAHTAGSRTHGNLPSQSGTSPMRCQKGVPRPCVSRVPWDLNNVPHQALPPSSLHTLPEGL